MSSFYIKRPSLEWPFWKVRFSNGRFIVMVRNVRKLNHPNTEHENVRYSNGFGNRMFGIRAPTVVETVVAKRSMKYNQASLVLVAGDCSIR